jgi:hypothetical protein
MIYAAKAYAKSHKIRLSPMLTNKQYNKQEIPPHY